MSCSRLTSGGAPRSSFEKSSSAKARSLCRISTPFTRAITVSLGSAAAGWEEDSLLHPLTTGRTRSAKAAIAATVVRGWRAGAVLVRGEGRFESVMTRSLDLGILGATAGGGAPGQSRNRFPFAMAVIAADFGRNMGRGSLIDKDVTPSYLSEKLAVPAAGR